MASNGLNNWNNSDLKSYLNGDYYNSIDETYKSMVSKETYYLGGASRGTTSEYYNAERSDSVYGSNPTSTKQYIGLIYPSDYGYASGNSCLSPNLNLYDTECASNNYLYSQQTYEWLQTHYNGNYANAITLRPNGSVGIDAAPVG